MLEPVRILFIAGDSRSGSTLLDLTLGQILGCFSAGELRYLWERGLIEDQLCGDNITFRDHPLWSAVVQHAFSEVDDARAEEMLALQKRIDHPRSVFRNAFYSPQRWLPSSKRDRAAYVEQLHLLYRAIMHETKTRFIIDSSKTPSHGLLLAAIPGVELHVIHLVRDARAVAFSMQRRKRRPEVQGEDAYMPVYPPWKAALRWRLTNMICRRFNDCVASYNLVRYEDFVSKPVEAIEQLIAPLGLGRPSLDFVQGHTLQLQANQTVAGNPMRFHRGPLELKLDSQWRAEMNDRDRRTVECLAGTELKRYGYI